jgi:anthranilate synthase component 1
MIGLAADTALTVSGATVTIEVGSKTIVRKKAEDPLREVEQFQDQYRVPHVPELPIFTGGLVGYFGYECVGYIEPRLHARGKSDPLGCPDIMLMVSDRVVVFDNLAGKVIIIVHADPSGDDAYNKAQHDLDLLQDKLLHSQLEDATKAGRHDVNESDFKSGTAREKFERDVERIKDYIVEGDVMQVVLSQRLSIPFEAPPLDLYRALRGLNPSPYMYFLDLGDFHIVGSSPEILVRLEDGVVTVRPIAGTRRRGHTEAEDRALERELMADPKEIAEHLMLIDLGRNDAGRVAEIGSVRVTDRMVVERYSHVMHIVSNVVGKLRSGLGPIDVLRATFPAGTVSGAPKIRAMEIIDELEPVKRGVYSGAVGYLSWNGNMDTAIAIRTAVIQDGTLHIQAGAGIVADSQPDLEWKETMNKGRAVFRAVAMAEAGIDRHACVPGTDGEGEA